MDTQNFQFYQEEQALYFELSEQWNIDSNRSNSALQNLHFLSDQLTIKKESNRFSPKVSSKAPSNG